MRRVLSLVTEAYGGCGGIAQACRDVLGAMAAQDAIDQIEILPRLAPEPPTGIPDKARQREPRSGRVAFSAAAIAAMRCQPDIVFCNHLYMGPLAAFIARLAGAKLIIQLHGVEIWQAPSPAQRRALEDADLLWCVSRDTRLRTLEYADIEPERALVVNNSVRPEFTPGDRESARSRFALGNEVVLLTVGRLSSREQYKGHDLVIAALARLRTEHPSLLYVIAGEGDDRHRLEAMARQQGVEDCVRFLGSVDALDLPDVYRAADLFVLPSAGEGFGIAFLEAMACGVPVIGLAIGGANDALADGELGTCAQKDDFPAALAHAVAAPRPDPEKLYTAVHDRFGPAVLTARVAQSINMLTSRP